MPALKWLLIVLAVGYGGLLAAMYLFQRSLMYFPDPRAPKPGKRLVIYFQGNAGGLDLRVERFRALTEDGTGLLALNYRGYGGSAGTPSETGLIADAQAAYEFARKEIPPGRIVLFGESLGTAVAIALAAEREVAALILDAPFTSAADIGAAAYPFIPVRWFMRDRFYSDRRIAKVRAPVLVLHGELDRIVSIRFGEKLFALANEPKRMQRFPHGGHVNLDDHGAMAAVKTFLAHLAGTD